MKKKIIQYWHQKECPDHIKLRQKTWQSISGLDYDFYDFDSALIFFKLNFGDKVAQLFESCAVPVMACDFIRYHVLAFGGGLYVDSSFICKNSDFIHNQIEKLQLPFITSVPSVDLTPEIVNARNYIEKILLTGILYCPSNQTAYFHLMSRLIQHMVKNRIDNEIPYVVGLPVLSAFDFLIRSFSTKSNLEIEQTLYKALPMSKKHVCSAILDFYYENKNEFNILTACETIDFVDVSGVFYRPEIDNARFSSPEHWTNHKGSIFK